MRNHRKIKITRLPAADAAAANRVARMQRMHRKNPGIPPSATDSESLEDRGRRTARLVRRARSASALQRRRAARALVRLHEARARAYARAILKDADLAEDAVQEAWLDCFRNLESLREPGAFAFWFRRLVFKQCDRIRRRSDFREVPGEPQDVEAAGSRDDWLRARRDAEDPAKIVGDALERRDIRRRLFALYRRLSRTDRRLVRMRFIEERPYQEIARELKITTDHIKNRIRILRKNLRPAIQSDAAYALPAPFRALSSARLAAGDSAPGPYLFITEPQIAQGAPTEALRGFPVIRNPQETPNKTPKPAPIETREPPAIHTHANENPRRQDRCTALDLRCRFTA